MEKKRRVGRKPVDAGREDESLPARRDGKGVANLRPNIIHDRRR